MRRAQRLRDLEAERDEAVKETEQLKREGSRNLATVRRTLEAAAAERSRELANARLTLDAAHAEQGGLETKVRDLRTEKQHLLQQLGTTSTNQGSLEAEVQDLRTERERLLRRLDDQAAGTERLKEAAEKEEEARQRLERVEREAQEACREAEAKGEVASRKRKEAEAAEARLVQDAERAEDILQRATVEVQEASRKRREGQQALREAEAKGEAASRKRREGQRALREAEVKEARLAHARACSARLGCEVKDLLRKLESTREDLKKALGDEQRAITEAAEINARMARMEKERKFLGTESKTAPWALISAPNAVPFSREVLVDSRNEHGRLGEDVELVEEGEEYAVRLSKKEVRVKGSDLKFRGSSCYDFFQALLNETDGVGSFDCVWIPDIRGCWREQFPKDKEQHQAWVCQELSKLYQCKEGAPCGNCAWFHHWAKNVRRSHAAGQELRFGYLERRLYKDQPRFKCAHDGKEYFVGKAQLVELTWVQEKMKWPVKPTKPDAILQEFLDRDFQLQGSLEQELSEERERRQELQSTLQQERAQHAAERAQREEEKAQQTNEERERRQELQSTLEQERAQHAAEMAQREEEKGQQTMGTLDLYEEARAARRTEEKKLVEKDAATPLQQQHAPAERQRGRRWRFWWRRRWT